MHDATINYAFVSCFSTSANDVFDRIAYAPHRRSACKKRRARKQSPRAHTELFNIKNNSHGIENSLRQHYSCLAAHRRRIQWAHKEHTHLSPSSLSTTSSSPSPSQPMKYEAIITLGNNEVIGWWWRTDITNDSTRTRHRKSFNIFEIVHVQCSMPFRLLRLWFEATTHRSNRCGWGHCTDMPMHMASDRQRWLLQHIICFSITFMTLCIYAFGIDWYRLRCAHTRHTWHTNDRMWTADLKIFTLICHLLFSIYTRAQNASDSLRVYGWCMDDAS